MTFIAHGGQWVNEPDLPAWVTGMGQAVTDEIAVSYGGQSEDVAQFRMEITEVDEVIEVSDWEFHGDFDPDPGDDPETYDLAKSLGGEATVCIDWSAVAGAPLEEWITTHQVADVASQFLLNELGTLGTSLLASSIHLIGHSRGASLIGALADELAQVGIWVEHATYLDAHPIAWPEDWGNDDFGATENIVFADSYWRQGGVVTPNGEPVDGAANYELDDDILDDGGYPSAHSDVHLWYHGTIDTSEDPPANNGEHDVPNNWYGGMHPSRTQTGYGFSRVAAWSRENAPDRPAAGISEDLGGNGERDDINWTSAVWPNLLEFQILSSEHSFTQGEEFYVLFRYQDYDSKSWARYYLDPDRNPYNDNAILVSSSAGQELDKTGEALGTDFGTCDTTGVPSAEYFVLGRISDNFGRTRYAYAYDSIIVSPGNDDPIADAGGPYSVNEGSTVTLDGSGSYDPDGTIEKYLWDLDNDGQYDDGSGVTVPFPGIDDSVNPVSLYVEDNDGLPDTDDTTVTVRNVPPKIESLIVNPSVVDENGEVTLSGSYTDPGTADTHELDIDWDDDGVYDQTVPVAGGSFSVPHVYLDDDPTGTASDTFDINVRLRDDDGGDDDDSTSVTVRNVAPAITTLIPVPTNLNENESVTLSGTYTDPSTEDTHELDIDWDGDGVYDQAVPVTGGSFSLDHEYPDDDPTGTASDTFDINVRLRDDDGGQDTDSTTVTVRNVAPEITKNFYEVNEGESVDFSDCFTDPGTQDTHTVVPPDEFFPDDDPTGTPWDEHTYSVTVTDDDTGTDTENIVVRVYNVPPELILPETWEINEGETFVYNGSFTDPGADTWEGWVDYDDGAGWEPLPLDDKTFWLEHDYYPDDDQYRVQVRIEDDDTGSSGEQMMMLTVENVAPTVSIDGPANVDEGKCPNGWQGTVTFADPGFDEWMATVDWGDGSDPETFQVFDKSFDINHIYADDAHNTEGVPVPYPLTVTIEDDDEGTGVGTHAVMVTNVGPSLWVRGMRVADEGTELSVVDIGMLTDPGFDNPDNPFYQPGGSRETFTASIDWGDGSPVNHPAVTIDMPGEECLVTRATFDGSHTYLDEGTGRYVATLWVADDDEGESLDRHMTVLVNNVAPFSLVLDPDPLVPVDEGQLATLHGTFEDPGILDEHTVTVVWGDSETTVDILLVGERSFDIQHLYKDDGPNPGGTNPRSEVYTYPIHVIVDDGDGGHVSADTTVDVHNVPPMLTVLGPQETNEGELIEGIIGWFTDTGVLDVHDAIIDWGDGTFPESGVVNQENDTIWGSHVYADENRDEFDSLIPYPVTVRVIDDDGGWDEKTFEITVGNVAPVLDPIPDSDVDEGETFSVGPIEFNDKGTLDTHTATVNWGDGHEEEMVVVEDPFGPPGSTEGMTGTIAASHCYADDLQGESYEVTVTLRDDDSGEHVRTFRITVSNVDPSLTVVSNQTVNEGTLLAITDIGVFTDPGFDNPDNPHMPPDGSVETFAYQIDWGDGSDPNIGAATIDVPGNYTRPTQGSFDGEHIYADNGIYTVTVTVVDDDGGEDTETFEVTVNNVAPDLTLNLPPDLTVDEGSELSLPGLGTFTDPAFADPDLGNVKAFAYRINWGDGKVDEGPVTDVTNGSRGVPTEGSFDASHIYADNGTYTVIVRVEDDDTDWPPYFDEETFTVVVGNVAPTLWLAGNQTATVGELLEIIDVGVLTDPGFDNPLNVGGEVEETFEYAIDWGDGTPPAPPGTVTIDVAGGPDVLTMGSFDGSHTYASEGLYIVTVTVEDDDTGSATEMFEVTVSEPELLTTSDGLSGSGARVSAMAATGPMPMMMMATAAGPDTRALEADAENVEPTLWGPGNLTGNEGEAIPPDGTDFGSFFDPDSTGPFAYRIEWGDGQVDEGFASIDASDPPESDPPPAWGSFDASHEYADNQKDGHGNPIPYSVTVTLTDEGGATTEEVFEVMVNNLPPTADPNGPYAVPEGGSVQLHGSGTDVPDDPLVYEWDLDGDGSFGETGTEAERGDENVQDPVFSAEGLDGPSSCVVYLRCWDGDDFSEIVDTTVNVANAPPTIVADNPTVTVNEGQTATNTGTYSDPGDDTIDELGASVGDITDNGDGTWSWSFDTTDGPDQTQTVTITGTDSDGDDGFTTFELVVNNVAPTVSPDEPVVTVNEGQTATNTGTYSDPGDDTIDELGASVGDITDNGDGTWSWSFDTTDGPDQTQTVTITGTDSDGDEGPEATFALGVNNVAPTVTADNGTVTVDEGDTAHNTGTYFDPGDDTITLVASIGDIIDNGDGTWRWSYDTTDGPDQTQTVTITATDSDGDEGPETTFELVVNNVPPTMIAHEPVVTVNEGQTATNTGTFFDPGDDTIDELSASVGEIIDNGDGTWSWSFDSPDGPDQTQTVTITATDSDGDDGFTTFELVVNNVPPTVVADKPGVTVDEGQTAANTGTYLDPGDDTIALTVSVGTISDNGDGTWSWSFDSTDGPDQTQTVTVTATDSDGDDGTPATFALNVNNVAPTVVADNATVIVDEGQTATNTGTYFDPGDDTIDELSASVGEITDNGDGTWSWSFKTSDGPDESQPVIITGTDSDGDDGITTFTLVVNNVAPTVVADNATVTVDEGQTATNTGTYDDPGEDTITLTASIGTIVDNGDGTWSWSFKTSDGPDESQPVIITGTDSDGDSTETSFSLVVNNVPPTVVADEPVVTVGEGQTATNTGTYSDPGDDTITLTASVGTVSDNGDGTWSWSFDSTDGPDQTQTVTVTATDSDGDDDTTPFELVVANLPPIAVDDYYIFDGIGTFEANVLDNDYDPGEDELTVIEWGDPSEGELTEKNTDGSFSYVAPDGFSGSVSFTCRVQDEDGAISEDSATVRIDVGMNASITGYAYATNEDSRFEPSHLGLPGVAVELEAIDGRGVVEINTLTGDDGLYVVDGLRAGIYRVTIDHPAACVDNPPHDHELVVEVPPNEESTNNNFYETWLRPECLSLGIFLSSRMDADPLFWGVPEDLRERMAQAEEEAGNPGKADDIRLGEVVQVARRGAEVTITGTALDEVFRFEPGESRHAVTVDDKELSFDTSQVTRIKLHTGGGNDQAELSDSVADDVLSARYNVLEMWSENFYDFVAFDIELARATSEKGGNDHKNIEPTIDFILKTFGDWEE